MNLSRIWALGGSFCRILRVWRGSGRLNLLYLTCLDGSGRFNLSDLKCLERSRGAQSVVLHMFLTTSVHTCSKSMYLSYSLNLQVQKIQKIPHFCSFSIEKC